MAAAILLKHRHLAHSLSATSVGIANVHGRITIRQCKCESQLVTHKHGHKRLKTSNFLSSECNVPNFSDAVGSSNFTLFYNQMTPGNLCF